MSQMLRATYSCLVVFKEKPSPYASYIRAPIDGEVLKKITSILEVLPVKDGESVLVLLWVPKEIGDACVLTTAACMPFRLFGNNKELQKYYLACLDHKLYVFRDAKEEAAFGLAGKAYLRCTPQQTQNVHEYPEDQRPPCEDAIFTKNWGSFAVPVIDANTRVGVLEFVMDTPRDYSNDIHVVQKLLQDAGLQISIQMDHTKRRYLKPKKMIRKSKSFDKTKYCRLAPLFGLSSAYAAEILELKPGTFTNVCRRVGIPEWPCIRNTRASSIPETKNNQMIAEISSFVTPNADFIPISYVIFKLPHSFKCVTLDLFTMYLLQFLCRDKGFPEWPPEQTMTSDSDAWLPELASLDFMANVDEMGRLDFMYDEEMINIDHLNADLNSIGDKGFPESSLEQTITIDSNALLPERVDPDFMADLGAMEFHANYAPSTKHLDFMDDELERMNFDNLNAVLNSIWDEGSHESSLEQATTIDNDALLPERVGPDSSADLGEMEHHDNYMHLAWNNLHDDTWINDMLAA
ncbi:hypothetical protein Hanom_Chr17g01532891 [Helianthus anomalus]